MKYLSYYQLKENPFGKYVANGNIFENEDVLEAAARIEYAVEVDGIALITGEPGTGKTTAVRKYFDELDPELYKLVYISASNFKVFDFYHILCEALDLSTESCQYVSLFKKIQTAFMNLQTKDHVKPVVVIDDAHMLSSRIIEEFKLFYDFDFDSRCYVSLILIGNSGIREQIRKNKFESLRDRIVANYDMQGMAPKESSEYIKSRIRVSGGDADLFNGQVLNAVHHAGSGNCRRMNTILTNMLMIGYSEKRTTFSVEDVKRARDEMKV